MDPVKKIQKIEDEIMFALELLSRLLEYEDEKAEAIMHGIITDLLNLANIKVYYDEIEIKVHDYALISINISTKSVEIRKENVPRIIRTMLYNALEELKNVLREIKQQ